MAPARPEQFPDDLLGEQDSTPFTRCRNLLARDWEVKGGERATRGTRDAVSGEVATGCDNPCATFAWPRCLLTASTAADPTCCSNRSRSRARPMAFFSASSCFRADCKVPLATAFFTSNSLTRASQLCFRLGLPHPATQGASALNFLSFSSKDANNRSAFSAAASDSSAPRAAVSQAPRYRC